MSRRNGREIWATYETRRVVVSNGLGIAKRFKQWVCLENFGFETVLALAVGPISGDRG